MKSCRTLLLVLLIGSLLFVPILGHAKTNAKETDNPASSFTDAELSKYTTLSVDSKGNEVIKLKNRLYELGYLNISDYSNIYSKKTAEYIKSFQKANKIKADGIATPVVQALLFSDKAIPKAATTAKKKDAFVIRNGISWGMHYDEIKTLTDLESLGEPTKDFSVLPMLKYEKVPVANMSFNMYLFILDDDVVDSDMGNRFGLMALFYVIPDYSLLSSSSMYDDYVSLIDSMTKKYGKPSGVWDQWKNDSTKMLFSEDLAAPLGYYQSIQTWEKKDYQIQLMMNSDPETLLKLEGVSSPTISICYYSKEFINLFNNITKLLPDASGL